MRSCLGLAGLLLAFGLALPLVQWLDAAYLITVLTRILILGLAASALNLVLGVGAMISFGHAAFVGVGAYVAAILSLHWYDDAPLFGVFATNQALVAWPLAALFGAIAALLIGAISLRTRGFYFIMITLAFAQMVYFFFVSLEGYGGDDGLSLWWGRNELSGLGLDDRRVFYYVCLAILAAWLIWQRQLVASPFGRILKATRENETRLAALGVDPFRHQLAAFALSGAICGLAGALLCNLDGFVSPSILHWSRSGELMIMCILGGLGTVAGPLIGAAALLLLEELLIPYTEHWQLLLGIALLALLLLSRGGLLMLWQRRRPAVHG
jgi:branched-chain amino acid transport system permease protein